MLEEIIDGVEMDLTITRYETFADAAPILLPGGERGRARQYRDFWLSKSGLQRICDRARARSSGDQHPARRRKDLANGRIYLPREDMARSTTPRRISRRVSTTNDS